MPEYTIVVAFNGTGRLKVRADSEDEACRDAMQMDPDDIEWDSHSMKVLEIEKVE